MAACDSTATLQHWWLDGQELTSGVPGRCLSSAEATSSLPWPATIDSCANSTKLLLAFNGSLTTESAGFCLSGTAIADCGYPPNQPWINGPGGQLIDPVAGLCLDDPGDSATAGTQLVLAPCYGQLGEIWALG